MVFDFLRFIFIIDLFDFVPFPPDSYRDIGSEENQHQPLVIWRNVDFCFYTHQMFSL